MVPVLSIVLLASLMPHVPVAMASPQGVSSVFLSPGVWSVAPGGSFTVNVMANLATGQNMSAIDVKINYTNPAQAIVRVDGLSYSGNIFENDPGKFLSQECAAPLYNYQCPQATDFQFGWLHFSEIGSRPVTGPMVAFLFSIHFQVDGKWTSWIRINNALLADPGSGPFPTPQAVPVTTQDGVFSNTGITSFFNYVPLYTPTVVAGYDNRFNATASLSLNATYSEIHINSYVWSFGDGATNSTPNPITNHIFGSSGQYNVNLTVIDANGNRGSSRLLVAVGQALGALLLTVVDLHSTVYAGVKVQIFNLTVLTPFANQTTDATGTVSFQNPLPGTYRLTFSGPYVTGSSTTESVIAGWTTQDTVGLRIDTPQPGGPTPWYGDVAFLASFAAALGLFGLGMFFRWRRDQKESVRRNSAPKKVGRRFVGP